jgi:uncharacterized coiled-coil protein SlyX
MRWLGKICFLVLVSGLALAQTNSGPSNTTSVADEVKALREAMAQQQQQIAQQQQQIDALKAALEDKKSPATPHVEDAALHTNAPSNANVVQGDEKPKESPLSFRIGGTEFTPGGFVDFENIFRTTNTGNVSATNFWAIPFSNTVQGHLTEYRATGQYSRFNLKVAGKYGANDVTGYVEADFNGNDAANVFITSNGHTNRLRLYWLDLKRGKWEFLGGQTWGLQTPNRVGVSPNPADLMLTYGEDAQVHVGVNYTRAAEFRAAYHLNDRWVWAAAVQNPQQFVGQGAEVTFPSAFNGQLTTQTATPASAIPQFDNNSNSSTPNLVPDLLTKLAVDTNPSGRHFHFEVGGVLTTAKATFQPVGVVGPNPFQTTSTVGGGVFGGVLLSITKDFRVVADGMWGPGVGRYLIAMAPQVVVVPVPTSATTFNIRTSPIHSGDGIIGLELQATPKTLFGAYYGGMYAARNAFPDLTAAGAVKPIIGFGGPAASAATNAASNRAIQEGSFDWTQTFWRNPQYGAVLLITQYSYVTRAPWFVPVGAPKNAHLSMAYLSVRYVLP